MTWQLTKIHIVIISLVNLHMDKHDHMNTELWVHDLEMILQS